MLLTATLSCEREDNTLQADYGYVQFKVVKNILHIDVMDIIIIVVMLQDFPIIN